MRAARVSQESAYLRDPKSGWASPRPVPASELDKQTIEKLRNGDLHALCPHCREQQGHNHRLGFRDEHTQPISRAVRNRVTLEIENAVTQFYFPPRYFTWQNEGEHKCHLKAVLGRYAQFAGKYASRSDQTEDGPIHTFNINMLRGDRPERPALAAAFHPAVVIGEDIDLRPRPSVRRSKGLKTIQAFAEFIAAAGDDPGLMYTERFRDGPKLYQPRDVIFTDGDVGLFQRLHGIAAEGEKAQFTVAYFEPLPTQMWGKYRTDKFSIPGRAVEMRGDGASIYVAQMLHFPTEELYKEALAIMSGQRQQGQTQKLLIAADRSISITEYERKLEAVRTNGGKSTTAKKIEGKGQETMDFGTSAGCEKDRPADWQTVWMHCPVNTQAQFMPAPAEDAVPQAANSNRKQTKPDPQRQFNLF